MPAALRNQGQLSRADSVSVHLEKALGRDNLNTANTEYGCHTADLHIMQSHTVTWA